MTAHKCYDCIHRREVPGDTHSQCVHPATVRTHRSTFMQLAAFAPKRGGNELAAMADAFHEGPAAAMRELHIELNPHGVANGWAVWPVSFDPTWLTRCDGFTLPPCGKQLNTGTGSTNCGLSRGHEGGCSETLPTTQKG